MKSSKIIISLLILSALGAGVYFRDNIAGVFSFADRKIGEQIKNFQETDIGSIVSEVGKQVLAPAPLKVGGSEKAVVLLKFKVIAETNIQRQNAGLPALKENILLDSAASAKANDMFKNQYFEHESPAGLDPGMLVSSHGYNYIIAGENLILGNFNSEKEVVQNWMDSPGHRANILNSRYAEIGVAIIKGTYNNETVWIGVQEFGFPLSACAQPDTNLKNQIDSDKIQLYFLSSQIDEKKNQTENTNRRSVAYNQMVDDYNQLVAQYNYLAEQIKSKISQYNTQINIFNSCVASK